MPYWWGVLSSPDNWITAPVDRLVDPPLFGFQNFIPGPFPLVNPACPDIPRSISFNTLLINDGDTGAAALARTEYGDFEFIGMETTLPGSSLVHLQDNSQGKLMD